MRLPGFHTTLHKIRMHTKIRGNDLADAAAKLAVQNFDTLSHAQTTRVDIGKAAPCPAHRVMYTVKLPRPDPALAIGTNCATLRGPWWTIPEADQLQMYAFTRRSTQLRLKAQYALLRF